MFTMGASSVIEGYTMSKMLADGPKVFTFDALTCEALENFDLNVSCSDYHQPFPSVVIELPQDYIQKRVVPFERGTPCPGFRRRPPRSSRRKAVLLIIRMSSHQVLTRLLKLDLAPTLEEVWDMGKRSWGPEDSSGDDAGGERPGHGDLQAGPERLPARRRPTGCAAWGRTTRRTTSGCSDTPRSPARRAGIGLSRPTSTC